MSNPAPASTRPVFNQRQRATLDVLIDLLWPADEASDAASSFGVADYIERHLAGPWGRGEDLYASGPHVVPNWPGLGWQSPLTPAQAVRELVDVVDASASLRWSKSFVGLDARDQSLIVKALEDGSFGPIADIPSPELFLLLRRLVLEGLLRDPVFGGNRDGSGLRWLNEKASAGDRL
jgi:hypothetical protein